LRRHYGGRKNRGDKPDKFYAGGGNIIRTILQQLEKAGLAKKEEKEVHKGRVLTPKGHKLISSTAAKLHKENPPEPIKLGEDKTAPVKIKKPKEEKKTEKREEKLLTDKKKKAKEEKKAEKPAKEKKEKKE
jgi:hypothetical protein